MLSAICLAAALSQATGPYNYTGKLTDLMPEGATWGMPATGLPMQITISDNGAKVGPDSFSLKGPQWQSEAPLKIDGLKYSDGVLTGTASFKNASGHALDAVRFDIVSATEQYKGKDAQGKDATLSRTLPVKEESPILFGDLPKDAEGAGVEFKATGLAWKQETTGIVVTAKLSGLTFLKQLYDEHDGSTLDFDSKGRLLMGDGEKPAIFRCDVDKGTMESITSLPDREGIIAVNPVDGTICVHWVNSHNFTFYSPGGDEKSHIDENGEVEGMADWPTTCHYDGKGNVYLQFGETVAQFVGGKPAFVLSKAGQYDFSEDVFFDVAKDGTIYVAAASNVFRFEPGGKNPKKILQGPDTKLGRIHGVLTMRVDPSNYLWVADHTDGDFPGRICVFDSNGKFVWTLGRGADKAPDEDYVGGQITNSTTSIAIAPDGRVFVAGGEYNRAVLAFQEF